MSGDFTRFGFDPADDFAAVLMQQGKVMVDADWNELVESLDRRTRAETLDTVGRCAVPRETPDGFLIELDGGSLSIGPGRAYADGLLAENRGGGELALDRSLAELRGAEPLRYEEQPYLPDPPELSGGDMLVYLDVWRREVGAAEDPGLRDPAIGFDTATRIQTVWQVRAHALEHSGDGEVTVDCQTALGDVPGWLEANPPADGRLTTKAIGTPLSDDPCDLPASGGYRGVENRLYRVEIHMGGEPGEATFKWSRDNASLTAAVLDVDSRKTLTVEAVGRDGTRRFAVDDWIEVLDDGLELRGEPGILGQVAKVDEVAGTIELSAQLPDDVFDLADPTRLHTRVRGWDQAGEVLAPDGSRIGDVDAGDGVITVPASGEVMLEDGVVISFSVAAAGRFRTGDHWCFAARTADGSVEELDAAPPRGIHHHFCALAVVESGVAHDCRRLWPAEAEEACGCSVCVSAESHASGEMTIQRAIDEVAKTGGTVCLGPGDYLLREPLSIRRVRSVRIAGQGAPATRILASGEGAAFVETSAGIEIRDVGIVVLGAVGIALRNVIGATLSGCSVEARGKLTRPAIGLAAVRDEVPLGAIAVGLAGVVADVSIRECALNAGPSGTAIGKLGAVRQDLAADRRPIALAIERYASIGLPHRLVGLGELRPASSPTPTLPELREAAVAYRPGLSFGVSATNVERLGPVLAVDLVVEDCYLLGRHGVALGGLNLLGGQTRIGANVVRSLASGIALSGSTVPESFAARLAGRGAATVTAGAMAGGPARVIVDRNLVSFAHGEGVVVGVETAHVVDNHLTGSGEQRPLAGSGVLAIGAGPDRQAESLRVSGNRIVGAARAAVSVDCTLDDLDVSGNLVSRPGRTGITMEDDARADAALIAANQLRDVAAGLNEKDVYSSGIRLVAARRAVITGNTVTSVATAATDAATRHGIQVIGASAVRIADNTVIGIGPLGDFAGTAVGIEVVAGAGRVDVSGNEVSRSGSAVLGAGGSAWRALRLGDPILQQLFVAEAITAADRMRLAVPTHGFLALSNPLSMFLAEGIRTLVTEASVFVIPELPEEITVRGNHLQANGRLSPVLIVTEGNCVFSENHVHRAGEDDEPAADLRAGALIVQGNRASVPRGVGLRLFADRASTTALGNVSTNGIELNGTALPNPWAPLNATA